MKRVLIADRGEIALRLARGAAAAGIESVGVYAAVDARALHVRAVNEARELPGRDPVSAYLDGAAIIAIAEATACDAVHPGYGFLSEQAAFARLCAARGLTFVGPPPEVLELFGDKVRARLFAAAHGVPVAAGSDGRVATAVAAADWAERLGYPVMLKAASGGGGRGMRVVETPDQIDEAFARCASEAAAAFGDGTLFVEQLVVRPRHIEVQVLADTYGSVVHLHDRDCSVQLRHQKVIEIAPAPSLDPGLRAQLHADAITLAGAAGFVNAGTFEFLVSPESGTYAFVECNPRLQVEHTVTEQVFGIDLVEAQLRVAAGETLATIGLAEVGAPRGFAVQARVVARGAGTLTAYHEPSGPGVRVDACGYAGYAPPPQFDPLLAKVIGSSGTAATLASALDRTARALAEFEVAGLPTNLAQLQAILAEPTVRSGDARTTLLDESPHLTPADFAPGVLAADVPDDHHAISCPMTASVLEVYVRDGDVVTDGQALLVISAMKMETIVRATCSGTITALTSTSPGGAVTGGELLAVIRPGDAQPSATVSEPRESWAEVLGEIRTLQQMAQARMARDSDDPGVVRQRGRGKLTCHERIDMLFDPGSFREVGSVAGFASYGDDGAIAAFTPANHVGGWGTIEGRAAIVCADDFTSRGGHSDGAIGAKSLYLDRLSMELRVPSVRLLDGSSGGGSVASMVPEQRRDGEQTAQESTGAITAGRPRVSGSGGSFLPGHLGSTDYSAQLATVPVVNMLLGSVVGIGAAKAVLGHFSVMVRDIAQLFVAGPPVVRHAMGYDVTKEDLGDWRIHCRNGSVDNLAETEEDAFAQVKRFLSYLPGSVYETPPVAQSADVPGRRSEELFTIVPRRRTTTFDVRRTIELIVDEGSFFEIGPLWGTDQVTGFARMNGHPVGVLASDSRHVNGGALTADGCSKLTRHVDLCDLFHMPLLNLIDNPGFAVGIEHEVAGTIRRGAEWMVAFAQVRVPIFTVLLRRSFGVAGNNFATPRAQACVRVAWPAADVGGIPPEGGIEAAYKRQLAEAADPVAFRAELNARIESARGPLGPLSKFQLEEMIDPRDTRPLVCEWMRQAYRIVGHADQLVPRPLQFRP